MASVSITKCCNITALPSNYFCYVNTNTKSREQKRDFKDKQKHKLLSRLCKRSSNGIGDTTRNPTAKHRDGSVMIRSCMSIKHVEEMIAEEGAMSTCSCALILAGILSTETPKRGMFHHDASPNHISVSKTIKEKTETLQECCLT